MPRLGSVCIEPPRSVGQSKHTERLVILLYYFGADNAPAPTPYSVGQSNYSWYECFSSFLQITVILVALAWDVTTGNCWLDSNKLQWNYFAPQMTAPALSKRQAKAVERGQLVRLDFVLQQADACDEAGHHSQRLPARW